MKTLMAFALVGIIGFAAQRPVAGPQEFAQAAKADKNEGMTGESEPLFKLYKDLKWEKLIPGMGDRSPELSILHIDPKTKATKMLIRCPVASGARKHWHTANETHTVIHGQVIYECDGKRIQMGPGSFNRIPSKMVHEAWSSAGSLVFVTLDGPWDIHHTDGEPTIKDIIKDPETFFGAGKQGER